jgi:hypothetical protein
VQSADDLRKKVRELKESKSGIIAKVRTSARVSRVVSKVAIKSSEILLFARSHLILLLHCRYGFEELLSRRNYTGRGECSPSLEILIRVITRQSGFDPKGDPRQEYEGEGNGIRVVNVHQ